ncbi:MAG: hypothetical protein EAZ11_10745 [Curvibacter sp.]|nr:MAG: hypothetical protein EAZ11_10745 [Curvibacter sp.]
MEGCSIIGLSFLAVGLLWLALSWYLAKRSPNWLSIRHPVAQWLMRAVVMLLLLVGPFVDHIVGMRQFEKLCAEDGRLEIRPAAVNTKRARQPPSSTVNLEGYVIPISQDTSKIYDWDTGEEIAQYRRFTTSGGRIGGLPMLGGKYTCGVNNRGHADSEKYTAFASQTKLTYGTMK